MLWSPHAVPGTIKSTVAASAFCKPLEAGDNWGLQIQSTLPQDFRTGYYTLTSPRALVAAQLVGAFIGVLFAPGVYAFYTHSFDVGVDYEYSVPYAKARAPR